ncbi:MAG: anthranilate phosphoribosyltransferase, partial [Pseudomonadota bacterium]
MIQAAINKAVGGDHLSQAEMMGVMDQVMEGQATPAQIGALLVALRMKGESVGEIAGAAQVMRQKCLRVPVSLTPGQALVDTCGTGGDGAQTFNISTVTALVVAGAGVKVAKHGNRSVSSRCGSADLLEALGVPLSLTPAQVGRCIDEAGIGFLFAPVLHLAMRHAIGPRRELGLRTIFNLLGPLTNPAGATAQVLGVYDAALVTPLAEVLGSLGCASAYVVHGPGGLDELASTGVNQVARLNFGRVESFSLRPEELGLKRGDPAELKGGLPPENARLCLALLNGQRGAARDTVLMNAAAALAAAGAASGLREGVALAARSLDGGAALARLEGLIATANRLAGSADPAVAAGAAG